MSSGWLALAAAVIGAGTTAYGASQNKKAGKNAKKNFDLYNEAMMLNEEEARDLFDKFLSGYYDKKEEMDGELTLQQYIENTVQTLDNPQLTAAYRNARNGDWAQAQEWADQGSEQNVSIFNKIVDNVSGGDYKNFIAARNKAVLGEDIESVYSEAERLRAPRIPAGSVKTDAKGEVIGGQRGDKFDFQTSVSAIKEFNDRSFTKTRTAIEDDRAASVRQQERAFNFLPQLNYAEFATKNVVQPFTQNKLAADLAELQIEAGLASRAMASALGAPMAPPAIDLTAGNELMSQGAKIAAAGIADLYKSNRSNQTTGTTIPQASSDGSVNGSYGSIIKPTTNIYS